MISEQYQIQIDLVRARHQYLDLTLQQAEKVCQFEQNRDIYNAKHFFSVWEEWDYELSTFREVLTDSQFRIYEENLKGKIEHHIKAITDQDQEKVTEISYKEALIHYYETQFLPELYKDPFLGFGWLHGSKLKIQYLRNEYANFLDARRKEILVDHYRNHKSFKPNELKASLLNHKLMSVFPSYSFFKSNMDKPTKVLAKYLEKKVKVLPDQTETLLTRKFKELQQFSNDNYIKYYGDSGGWHTVYIGKTQVGKETTYRNMSLLLLGEGIQGVGQYSKIYRRCQPSVYILNCDAPARPGSYIDRTNADRFVYCDCIGF